MQSATQIFHYLDWSYQLNSPAEPTNLPHFLVKGLLRQRYLAGSSIMAPRILIFSIVIGAEYSSELIFMPTWVPAFYAHNDLFQGGANSLTISEKSNSHKSSETLK